MSGVGGYYLELERTLFVLKYIFQTRHIRGSHITKVFFSKFFFSVNNSFRVKKLLFANNTCPGYIVKNLDIPYFE